MNSIGVGKSLCGNTEWFFMMAKIMFSIFRNKIDQDTMRRMLR